MPTNLQNNLANPMVQEAYQLIGQLSEKQLSVIVKYIKKIIDQNNICEIEREELQRKRAAFNDLLELRKKIAATHPKSMEEERFEAISEKISVLER